MVTFQKNALTERSKFFLSLIISGLAYTGTTWAEITLEEIVVVAQKREQNLQDVPISISALTSNMLLERGTSTTDELGSSVPGLVMQRNSSSLGAIIRGIGQANSTPGLEVGVATYIDGTYIAAASATNMSLVDIERIEVLRGPQGTLFGRNATGGLIHIITKKPQQELEGKVSVSFYDPEATEGQFYLSGGLTDKVSASFSAHYRDQSEGHGVNQYTGNDNFYREEELYRAKVLFDISEGTSLLLTADYGELDSDLGITRRHIGARLDGLPEESDYFDTNTRVDNQTINEQWGVSATLDHSFDHFDSKLIAAYREAETVLIIDQSFSTISIVDFPGSFLLDETFTLEGQITSKPGSSLEWIMGAFYLESNPEIDLLAVIPNSGFYSNADVETESIAVFGQATYPLNDATNLTAGLRWTRDEKDLSGYADIYGFALGLTAEDSESWSEVTWRISLDHQFNDNFLGYISYNRGFKSGIFNLYDLPLPSQPALEPEILDTYEIGFKADMMDARVRVNMAIYYNDYSEIQLSAESEGLVYFVNAAEATTYGSELEVTFLATENLTLFANGAYTNAEFDSFPDAVVYEPNIGQCDPSVDPINCTLTENVAGNKLPSVPEFTFTIGANYEQTTTFGSAGFSTSVYWSDERPFLFNNLVVEDAYTLISADVYARFGAGEKHELRLFGRNLLDEEYAYLVESTNLNTLANPALGRNVGIKYTYEF